jgi:hypothetical protein
MLIYFTYRRSSLRSIAVEAYLNSPSIEGSRILSSGTAGASDKARNLVYCRMTLELLEKHGIGEFAKAGYRDQLTQPLCGGS